MKVCDFMSKNVISVSPDTSLTDAKALMIKEKINKLPVVDKSKKPVGIITKNDLQKAAPSSASTLDMYELGYLLSKLKVEKIMVKNVRTVDFDEVIEEAARTMATEKIGCLPVMKDGILSGIITETDLFNAFISMFGATLPGVRAVIEVAEKPGELARIATAVAAKNGNIVSVVTTDGSDVSKRIITVKIGNLSKETVEEIKVNDEYYETLGLATLEATIKNVSVLKDVDKWTDNWTLTYGGENDDSCKVNVTSRLYKPNQSNKYAFTYRPIDLNNPFPNRNAGVNWYDWYSIPANKERLKSSYSKEEYQVILDNQSVSKIKEYNKNNNYLDWKGINEETGKSEFIERILEGGNP